MFIFVNFKIIPRIEESIISTKLTNKASIITKTITTAVVATTSFLPSQVTFVNSQ